jgi:predicted PurR-regulated permease PerM
MRSRLNKVQLDIAPAAIIKVVVAYFAVQFLIGIWHILVLVCFALMATAAFNPLVRHLQVRLNRTWAVLSVMLAALVVLGGFIALLAPPMFKETTRLIQSAPRYAQQIQVFLDRHHVDIHLETVVQEQSARWSNSIPDFLSYLENVFRGVAGIVVVVVLSIYLLIDGTRVGNGIASLLPRKHRLGARRMISRMGSQVGGYVRGQVIASVLAGTFSFVLLMITRVPEALALAALAALMDVIPFIGTLISTVAAVTVALTISPAKALIVLIAYLCYHQLESNVIVPGIYGNTLNLSLSVIVISVLIGSELLGILGVMLALPVAAAVPSVVAYIAEWREERDREDGATAKGDQGETAQATSGSSNP